VSILPASFRDPSGFVFRHDSRLYRQINRSYQSHYELLQSSGLYQNLTDAGLLVRHEEADLSLARTDDAARVIQPEEVPFISYPYEWCFSQLKDAALATLAIQKRAMRSGMTLKDASAYNIQFLRGRPVLIDTLSFGKYEEGRPWVAYRQFCQHFLAPLALMSCQDVRLSQMLRVHMDGIPLDLTARLLPRRSYLKPGLLLHLHFHARGQRAFRNESTRPRPQQQISRQAVVNLIDNLTETVKSLSWQPVGEDWNWTDYYSGDSYTEAGFEHKKQLVQQFLRQIQPSTVCDLGANTGVYSRIASAGGAFTLSCDVDPGAVEKNYRRMIETREANLHPLLVDLTNPGPALGWASTERDSFTSRARVEAVMALALIHHLAISNNVPLEHIARLFAQMGRWLIVEFVPKSDPKVQQLLVSRADIFTHYTREGFEAAFASHFEIIEMQAVQDSERRLCLMKAKLNA
jgi:hypothetical protein